MLWMQQDTQAHIGCKGFTIHPSMQHVTGLHVTGLHVTGLLVTGHTHIVRGGPRADCAACPGRFGVLPIPCPSPIRPKPGPKPSFTDEPL